MTLEKYDCSWIGIDGGREGLWKEPIWLDVLKVVSGHEGEKVYDENSPIYVDLEKKFPNELWRSHTKQGDFRPLFRDYSHAWTRTGVLSLENQQFRLTPAGKEVLAGKLNKPEILIKLFKDHEEKTGSNETLEKPFSILASGMLVASRPLSTQEIYWSIMKNYRPGLDDLALFIRKKLSQISKKPEPTPYRRLRNMLSLMREAEAITSSRQGPRTVWHVFNASHLNSIK